MERDETVRRPMPGDLADRPRADPPLHDGTERLEATVPVAGVGGYSPIAVRTDPTAPAGRPGELRGARSTGILGEGGTVMPHVGDAVMAVLGAPFPRDDHTACALRSATVMHARPAEFDGDMVDGRIDA